MNPLNSEVFFKKLRKPLDDRFLLFRAVAAAKAGDRREDLVDIRAGRFERTVAERIGNKALRLRGRQLFLRDDLLQLLLLLLLQITLPASNVNASNMSSSLCVPISSQMLYLGFTIFFSIL